MPGFLTIKFDPNCSHITKEPTIVKQVASELRHSPEVAIESLDLAGNGLALTAHFANAGERQAIIDCAILYGSTVSAILDGSGEPIDCDLSDIDGACRRLPGLLSPEEQAEEEAAELEEDARREQAREGASEDLARPLAPAESGDAQSGSKAVACDGCEAGEDWSDLPKNPTLCEPCKAHLETL